MERMKLRNATAGVPVLALTLVWGSVSNAQEQTQEQSRETTTPAPEQLRQKADVNGTGCRLKLMRSRPAPSFWCGLKMNWVLKALRRTKGSK